MATATIYGDLDTTLEELLPESGQGHQGSIVVGLRDKVDSEARGLLLADLTSELSGVASEDINSATLYMYVETVAGETDGTYNGYRCTRYDWTSIYATWLYYDEELEWTVEGGDIDPDTGFDGNPWTVVDGDLNDWKTVDVTEFLKDAIDSRSGIFNARLSVTAIIEEGQEHYYQFISKEGLEANWWYILVDYTPSAVEFVPQVQII